MDYQTLKTEIETGPLAAECAGRSDKEIADILSAVNYQIVKSRFITARSMLAELPDAATILDKLEATSSAIPAVKWAMVYIKGEGGIDIGHPGTITQMDGLAQAGIITVEEATAVKNMALAPASRAEVIGLGSVTYGDVSIALRGNF